jgi:hypothetical protein
VDEPDGALPPVSDPDAAPKISLEDVGSSAQTSSERSASFGSIPIVDHARAVVRLAQTRAHRILALFLSLVAVVALVDLAVRAAVRLDENWDGLVYHIPFAAIRAGIPIPYEISDQVKGFLEGFPPLPEFTQGILWSSTGSINTAGLANYLAFLFFVTYCHLVLRAPFYLVALISLTAPLVLIHSTVLYVDLFGNALLAIGMGSCMYLYLFPEKAGRAVIVGGLVCLTAAAWSKYQLVPVVALGFCLFALLAWRYGGSIRVSRRQLATFMVLAVCVASIPYVKNLAVYGNPFWPVKIPVIGDLLPYVRSDLLEDQAAQKPYPLKDLGQFPLFVRSLFEIDVPTTYPNAPRWGIDQWGLGPASLGFRMGGFWFVGVIAYLTSTIAMLFVLGRRKAIVATASIIGVITFVGFLPQAHELRYYMFIPLTLAAIFGMLFPYVRTAFPKVALVLPIMVLVLFLQMVSENRTYYTIEEKGYVRVAQDWGATALWPEFERGQVYCAVGFQMMARSILMTGPTMSEYHVVARSVESLCPAGSFVVTPDGVQGRARS